MVKEVLSEERNRDLVLLALERSKDSLHLRLLVGHQNGTGWLKAHLVAVLLGDAPLVLDWDSRLILDWELLLA